MKDQRCGFYGNMFKVESILRPYVRLSVSYSLPLTSCMRVTIATTISFPIGIFYAVHSMHSKIPSLPLLAKFHVKPLEVPIWNLFLLQNEYFSLLCILLLILLLLVLLWRRQ